MLSNYPPGVTGNELEIAGPDWEGEIEVTCGERDVSLQCMENGDIDNIKRIASVKGAQGSGKTRDADVIQQSLRRALSRLIDVTLAVCPFEGEVAAWRYRRVLHWQCPLCGTEHEREDGPPGE